MLRSAYLLTALALAVLLSVGCSKVVEQVVKEMSPRVTAVNVSLTDLTATDATIRVATTVENPGPVAAIVKDLKFTMKYWRDGWNPLAEGKLDHVELNPEGSLEIVIPTTTKHKDALGAVRQLVLNQGSLRLKVDGLATAKVGSSEFTIPFGQEFTLSMSVTAQPSSPTQPPSGLLPAPGR